MNFAQIFVSFFFLASIFQETECSNRFFAQIFGEQIFPQIFAQIFRRLFFDVLALQKLVFRRKSAENLRRPNGPARGGYPIPSLLSRADGTSHNRRQAHVLKESM